MFLLVLALHINGCLSCRIMSLGYSSSLPTPILRIFIPSWYCEIPWYGHKKLNAFGRRGDPAYVILPRPPLATPCNASKLWFGLEPWASHINTNMPFPSKMPPRLTGWGHAFHLPMMKTCYIRKNLAPAVRFSWKNSHGLCVQWAIFWGICI